ncbi:LGFP repeat-containing protein [Williamsia sp. MIQD14]|uniref:LGFP repeat-containing protein n=1 Tax=Williamsia sp. MIQD14 TaxID=3425703 RepID=UPI003DA16CE8
MQIKKRATALTVAAMAAVLVGSAQTTAIAGADEIGEYTVGGRILEAFKATGGVEKWGEPTMDEAFAADRGRFQRFDKGTSFYWKANVSNGIAHPVSDPIRTKWGSLGFERGALKFPTTNEIDAAGKGRKQFFQGGNVYSGDKTGQFAVWGGILGKYAAVGGPGGKYGMPTSNEYRIGRNYAQNFEGGRLVWP